MTTTFKQAAAVISDFEPTPRHFDSILRRSWTKKIDQAIGNTAESIAAALIVLEVIILASGVFWRFVLDDALTWSDELAANLFLWIVMMGSVGAYRRDEHMRLTMLVKRLSTLQAEICNVINTVVVAVVCLALLGALVWPAVLPPDSSLFRLLGGVGVYDFFSSSYLTQEYFAFTPALQIPILYILLGIVCGLIMILALAVMRLMDGHGRIVLPVLASAVAVVVIGFFIRNHLAALGDFNLILFFVIFLGAQIALGIPIAFAFGASTLSYLAITTSVPLSVVAGQMQDGMTNLILLSVPLFILLGFLMEGVGIARRLVAVIAAFVGHMRGGLNIVLVAAMFLVSGISGSKMADMAAITPVLFPEMERRGYKRSEMLALLSTSGAMADLIPPAIVLIIIGTVCNLSIKSLFIAGLLPAVLTSLALIGVSLLRFDKGGTHLSEPMRWAARGRVLLIAIPGLILPIIIRFMVTEGVATATEVSTVGVIYTLVVGIFVYREFNWRTVYPMLRETANLTGAIMLIIAVATSMSWALTQSGFAGDLAQALENAPGGKAGFLILSSMLFIVLGMVLEGIPVIVLFGPLLFPVAQELGIDEIHYAIVVILAMSIGLFSPPFGVSYYGACAIGKCNPDEAAVAIMPYIAALIGSLIVIAAIPWLSIGFL